MNLIINIALVDMQFPFILALLGKEQIADKIRLQEKELEEQL